MDKPEAILEAIRNAGVGDKVIIHNDKGCIWKILEVICIEHEEGEEI